MIGPNLTPTRLRLLLLWLLLPAALVSCAPSIESLHHAKVPPYVGPIQTVAVVMEGHGSFYGKYQSTVYDDALTILQDDPYVQSRFDMVERKKVTALLREQDLVKQGYAEDELGPRLGKLVGANYVLFIDLTDANANVDAVASKGNGVAVYHAHAAVSMRLVDTETGIVAAHSTGTADFVNPAAAAIEGVTLALSSGDSAILDALPQAINRALYHLLLQIA
jgi:curli biogenesis system outer membrane secretion channel CsgG